MTPSPARRLTVFAAAAGFIAAAFSVAAPAAAQDAAGAGTAVARISVVQGTVGLQRGEGAPATPAVVNAPVLAADYVTTAPDARAEVQLDAVSAVRLGAGVQLRFTHLDAADRDLQLAEGTIEVRLLRYDGSRTEVETPSLAVRPRAAGSYRITVDADGRTRVTVRSGQADAVLAGETRTLTVGTTLLAQGPAANPSVDVRQALALDDFDRFNAERDQRELPALTAAYAPPSVAGIADLNAYGNWVTDGGYGSVWVPSVAPGWAPYRDGSWSWQGSYGWTWIGYEPWGWAPYHYGRWHHSPRYGWCWVPAHVVVPWSPALVAFVPFGGVGFGNIGWVPLAPFEPLRPWWGRGLRANVITVSNVKYANAPYATRAPGRRFLEGRPAQHVAVDPGSRSDDPWTRFGKARAAPLHTVQILDAARGSSVRSSGVWSRFDGNANPRPQSSLAGEQRDDLRTAPARRHDPETSAGTQTRYAPSAHPEYAAPVHTEYGAPAHAGYATPAHEHHAQPAQRSEPVRSSTPHEHHTSSQHHAS